MEAGVEGAAHRWREPQGAPAGCEDPCAQRQEGSEAMNTVQQAAYLMVCTVVVFAVCVPFVLFLGVGLRGTKR